MAVTVPNMQHHVQNEALYARFSQVLKSGIIGATPALSIKNKRKRDD
jgi:hypothetical protein